MLIFQKIVILKKVLNAIKCEVKIQLLISLVCVTEQHYVSIFFTRLWAVVTAMLSRYLGRLVTNQQKM